METTQMTVHGDGTNHTLPAPPSPTSGALQIRSLDDLARLSDVLAQSGYFKDARGAAQAAVKVLYGAEIGIGPVQAMMNVHVIEGKPAPGAGLVAALIKRSGKYTYRVLRHEADGCEIEFYEKLGSEFVSLGTSSFDEADAKRAGLMGRGPWKAYPKAMMFARAVTQGARTFCPDVFGGAVYDPEELGGETEPQGRRPAAFPGESVYAPGVQEADVEEVEEIAEAVAVEEHGGPPAQLSLEDQMADFKARAKKARDWLIGLPQDDFPAAQKRADEEMVSWRPHEAREMGAMYVAQAIDKRNQLAQMIEQNVESAADAFRQGEDAGELVASMRELVSAWPDYWQARAADALNEALKAASAEGSE